MGGIVPKLIPTTVPLSQIASPIMMANDYSALSSSSLELDTQAGLKETAIKRV